MANDLVGEVLRLQAVARDLNDRWLLSVLELDNERGAGAGPSEGWAWDGASWEWSRIEGAADEEHEPVDLTVRHAAYWMPEEGDLDDDSHPWMWEVVPQVGQGDAGDPVARGSAPTARRAMLAADEELREYLSGV